MENTVRAPALRRAARLLLDAVLPPRCLNCGALVGEPATLCAACWSKIAFLGGPACACCGLPFEHELGSGALCAACAGQPPAFARARAVFRYDEGSRGLLLAFKHADRTDAVPAFALWLQRAGEELLEDAELIAPVPLHRWRLLRRRYNQSALLANALALRAGRRAAPDLLLRRRATPPQGRLSAAARRRNLAGALALNPRWAERVAGRRVLLIDDVLTTGATVEEAAKVLCRAGAAAVDVLTLARVILASS